MSCDSGCNKNNNNRKSGSRSEGETIPEARPNWLKCPPTIRERAYPVPDGVDISPISEGGRNGPKKNKFKCGQCGEDKKPKDIKPNAPADCPMMKSRVCTGFGDDPAAKKVSILDRVKNLFGIGKEDMRLTEACKHLRVEDEQIRHHRDVFNTQLFCRKDGYFSPFFTKVDCQSPPDGECTCGQEEVVEEEDCEEDGQEDQEYDEDDENSYEDQDVDVVCAEGESETVVEQEDMICKCQCITVPAAAAGCGDEAIQGTGVQEEEECVEDAQGECIIEESAECMDPACKFFLEDQDDKKKSKNVFDDVYSPEERGKQDCTAMNNFIIRVQAPFSESTTNETCEQIVARLTNKMPRYPEPGPRPEKSKTGKDGKSNEEIQIVVKQISVEDPTCECEDPKPKCKSKGKPKDECNDFPPPPPPTETDECNDFPPPPPKDECNDVPPPPPTDECNDFPPPPPTDECNDSTPPPPKNESDVAPQFQNDCEVLSEEELLKKPLKDIKCGCPKPTCLGCQVCPSVTRTCADASVWIPPPPPPCSRCGTAERGTTEGCYLCNITKRMRSGCPEVLDEKQPSFIESLKIDRSDSCSPEYLEDGSIKYKGGMCMSLANSYLWHIVKRTTPGGFFDRFTGECGEEEKLKASTGSKTYSDAVQTCFSSSGERVNVKFRGGDTMDDCKKILWGEDPEDEEKKAENVKRVCKPKKEASTSPPPQCPPRPPQ